MTSEDLIEISKRITNIYLTCVKDELKIKKIEIINILNEKFSQFDNKYNLSYCNSVYPDMKVYSIIGRVKEDKSLYEKLHRKNLIFSLISEFNLQKIDDINTNIDKIKIKIRNDFDDNIGCRIVCDLRNDVLKSFELISNHVNDFDGIEFLKLEEQPKTKKNGLDIYKIDCIYDNIKFELQIKSKIESAWDDLEHDLYYKEHSVNIVKEINNKSLNHIGKLLKQLDVFMCDLRDLNINSQTLDSTKDLIKLEQHFMPKIKTITKDFSFNFSNISNELLFILSGKIDDLGDSRHFLDKLNNINNDRKIRHDTWELIILESIYDDVCPKNDNPPFIEIYFKYILSKVNIDETLVKSLKDIYTYCFNHLLGSKHLFKLKNYEDIVILFKQIQEIIFELSLDNDLDNDLVFEFFGKKYFDLEIHHQTYEDIKNTIEKVTKELGNLKIDKNSELNKIIKKLGNNNE